MHIRNVRTHTPATGMHTYRRTHTHSRTGRVRDIELHHVKASVRRVMWSGTDGPYLWHAYANRLVDAPSNEAKQALLWLGTMLWLFGLSNGNFYSCFATIFVAMFKVILTITLLTGKLMHPQMKGCRLGTYKYIYILTSMVRHDVMIVLIS